MLEINCAGTPYEVGFEHGTKAASQIHSTIHFYTDLFHKKCNLSWEEACKKAQEYAPHIHEHYPALEAEMRAIAQGAGVAYDNILALNVRSELVFGASMDGCTSISWKTDDNCYLGQNWDWMVEQKPNVVLLQIDQPSKPVIQMMTEAGMIGKIGLNSAGLGLCVNAIRCAGSDVSKTPIHLLWRTVLECTSVSSAVQAIEAYGSAGACNMFIADGSNNIGVEVTHRTTQFLKPDAKGRIFHSNHMLQQHPGTDLLWLGDTIDRVKRIEELANELEGEVTVDAIHKMLCDEDNHPCSINREQVGESDAASVFSITMDLSKAEAIVSFGRPSKPDRVFQLRPRDIRH
ncbi:isopenicillin-N N-acyltransferase [Exophiala viscosa]|uniref:Isopenicillin-N N-acyltransferase n=1 Tax=Exophiala viscosa TaxID=2486360 RepID=A0AAN6DXR4_9EURO|nr:isopenicillin-N N-acyltransferase [Exophiala viscosa]